MGCPPISGIRDTPFGHMLRFPMMKTIKSFLWQAFYKEKMGQQSLVYFSLACPPGTTYFVPLYVLRTQAWVWATVSLLLHYFSPTMILTPVSTQSLNSRCKDSLTSSPETGRIWQVRISINVYLFSDHNRYSKHRLVSQYRKITLPFCHTLALFAIPRSTASGSGLQSGQDHACFSILFLSANSTQERDKKSCFQISSCCGYQLTASETTNEKILLLLVQTLQTSLEGCFWLGEINLFYLQYDLAYWKHRKL